MCEYVSSFFEFGAVCFHVVLYDKQVEKENETRINIASFYIYDIIFII